MSHPQAGILNRPPDHAVYAAFTFVGADPDAVRTTTEGLRAAIERELRSELDNTTPSSDKATPSDETGELGFESGYDRYHLTITVGFSKSFYEKLGLPVEDHPQDLVPINWALLKDAPTVTPDNGDLVLQVCSESIYVTEHVVRRVEEELGDELQLLWILQGSQRHTSRSGRVNREEGRALIGFLDGTSNLDPKNNADDAKLVFVDPDPAAIAAYPAQVPPISPTDPNPYAGPGQPQPVFPADLRTPPTQEPAWTKQGTYLVIRGSVVDLSRWDNLSLGEQEQTVGRFKVSGSALDGADDPSSPPTQPNFGADPTGTVTRLASHIRKANPRGPRDELRRIFRRGYPLILADGAGYRRGLVFAAFGRTLTTQFEFITRAWTTNPDFPVPGTGEDLFRQFEAVLCGGYFFVPALDNANNPWSWHVPKAAS